MAFDASLPVKNAELKTSSAILGYARTPDLWGKSGKFDVIVPYSALSGTADVAGQSAERNVNGLADARFSFINQLLWSTSTDVARIQGVRTGSDRGRQSAGLDPSGQYDDRRVVNIATGLIGYPPLSAQAGDQQYWVVCHPKRLM